MRLKISHCTRYAFRGGVKFGLQQLRETPKTNPLQRVLDWTIRVEGGKKELSFEDQHLNAVDLISFERDARELVVTCEGEVEIKESHGIVGRHRSQVPLWLYQRETAVTRAGAGIRDLVRMVEGESALERLHSLMRVIHGNVGYEVGVTHPGSSAEDVIVLGRGVCQDHTHIFLSAARSLGFPARYVSGYLMLNDSIEQDAMHAWAEAHVEALGWVGFDVSNAISPDIRYVRVATGLDYSDAAPVTGMWIGGSGEALDVAIRVAQQ